ncbi:MAG: dicarboxylate/amino acid:cation symporter [Cyanobacteria bacterium]|nr:dicarboxylate/amino acid:cation symporter [Cyanobacteria bacterium CG_2015-16_32_12]NCO76715.1 dicarboxylate/amino acid:cation symporter [Cyanobacteria bacterium CG_2015-22_32_23]NCQ03870.1 dicarboxylate/amino acid:cation symporter [Cyanobacteria bacterium CG_2015-09_32_10]NCQ40948.1 dicarboxylate/amino acid:cation symporter [Cyanobacteria bacterium CG_2015-04_32_10]NCS85267.1 dicarboxylate/amino acid:cation symporter [Cyanobacteria bacterium CG_2015-02_32_10]
MNENISSEKEKKSLLIPILMGIFCGVLLGGFLPTWGREIYFLGELFINSLLMLVIPLVMTSMISSITGLGDLRLLKGIGLKTISLYMVTTGIAVILGLILVSFIQPGIADNENDRVLLRGGQLLENIDYTIQENQLTLTKDSLRKPFDDRYLVLLLDQNIRGVIEKEENFNNNNLTIKQWENQEGEITIPVAKGKGLKIDLTIAKKVMGKGKKSISETLKNVIISLLPRNLFQAMANNDVLPIIIFSLIFGAILTTFKEGVIVINFFNTLNITILKIVDLILLFAPIGIGALIAGRLGEAGGFSGFAEEFLSLGKYTGTVMLGLFLHGFGILFLLFYFITKRSPFVFFRRMLPALTTAFSTASSSATIPVTLECAIKNNKIEAKIADFVIPLGATINMDGTALYEAVAAVFIAQIYGIELTIGQIIVIFLTATLAAIGAAGIPEAGLVTMVIVLKAVDIPIEGISLILVIDWFLDRCRTTVNVWGDVVVAAMVQKMENKQ